MYRSLAEPTGLGEYQLISQLFLRLMGLFYLIAFASLSVQIEGLAGSDGILPFHEKLAAIDAQHGWQAYVGMPTLFWLNASDNALFGATIVGAITGLLILFKRLQRPALILAFALYLSLYHASQIFLNFQWDTLLLEAGFLSIFLGGKSPAIILLFRWLLFRLRFMSGVSKLVSMDPAWSGLTALGVYFEVQPLPNPISWTFHHFPEWLLKGATAATLIIEILVPLMMFLPRRWRFIAAWITIFWQLLIMFTSNHNWINLLTIALCLFLFDDRALRSVSPMRLLGRLRNNVRLTPTGSRLSRSLPWALFALIFAASALQMVEQVSTWRPTGPVAATMTQMERMAIINKYHVFPTMKTERYELEIEGSIDGHEWRLYEFKYKPDDPSEAPGFIIPHQPRLDWLMWFVTLHPRFIDWFGHFQGALLDNSPAVIALLDNDPFPDTPPNYLRVTVWQYHFADPETRAKTGQWWTREAKGLFSPMPGLIRSPELDTLR